MLFPDSSSSLPVCPSLPLLLADEVLAATDSAASRENVPSASRMEFRESTLSLGFSEWFGHICAAEIPTLHYFLFIFMKVRSRKGEDRSGRDGTAGNSELLAPFNGFYGITNRSHPHRL